MKRIQVSFERVVLVKEKVGRYELPRAILDPQDAYNAIKTITNVQEEAQEVFGVLILNTKHKIVAVHEVSRGTLNSSRSIHGSIQASSASNAATIIASIITPAAIRSRARGHRSN